MALPLLDIHCHGAVGHSFGQTDPGSRVAAAHHRRQGICVVASLVSGSDEDLCAQVRVLAPLVAEGVIAGVHLEGPHLSHERRGAHDPRALRAPDPSLISRLVDLVESAGAPGAIKQMTFAPELPGSDRLIDALARHGILPAIGHTDADATTTARALGAIVERTGRPALATHLFNGMPPLHHRAGGPVAAILAAAARGECVVELICDGVHVAPEVVRMVFETVGPQAIAVVSDAMSATGLGDGPSSLGGLAVTVDGGTARLVDGGAIAGSTCTLDRAAQWATVVAGVDETDVSTATTLTPRRVLGLAVDPHVSEWTP